MVYICDEFENMGRTEVESRRQTGGLPCLRTDILMVEEWSQ